METPNWDDLYIFERVAHYGSLSEASRRLKMSQPTVSRHIQSLEKELRFPLFKRHIHGVQLTVEGERLLETAKAMRRAYLANWENFDAQNASLEGTVRITTSVFLAETILPSIVTKIRADAPEIKFVILPSNAEESLIFRDVDIAIRLFASEQANVISKRIGLSEIGCYGARSYFEAHPKPETIAELTTHPMIGYDERNEITKAMATFGFPADAGSFPLRSDSDTLNWALLKAGAGLGFAQRIVADQEPLVERALPDVKFPSLTVWLAASDTLKFVPRLRYVWDALDDALSALIGSKP